MTSALLSSEQGLIVGSKESVAPTYSFNFSSSNEQQTTTTATTVIPSQVSRVVTKESLSAALVDVAPETNHHGSSSISLLAADPYSTQIDDSSSLFEFSLPIDNKESELLSLPLTAIELPLTPPPLTEAEGGDSFESCAATLLTPAVSESEVSSLDSSAISTAAAIAAASEQSQLKAAIPAPPISIRAPPIVSVAAPPLPVVTPKTPGTVTYPKPKNTIARARSNNSKANKVTKQHQQRPLLQQRPRQGGTSPAPVIFSAAPVASNSHFMSGMNHQPPLPSQSTLPRPSAVPTPMTVAAPAATAPPRTVAAALYPQAHQAAHGGQQLPSTTTAVASRKYAPVPTAAAAQVPTSAIQYAPLPQQQQQQQVHTAVAVTRPAMPAAVARPRASSSASQATSASNQTTSNTVSTLHPTTGQVENTGRWTAEEHRLFLQGLEQHGKGWKKIATLIKSRTVVQIRTHAQKYFQKLAKARQNGEAVGVAVGGMPPNGGGVVNGGVSVNVNNALAQVGIPMGTAEGDGTIGIAIPMGADGQPVVTMRTTTVATSAHGNMSLGSDATSLAAAQGQVNIATGSVRGGTNGGRKRRNAPGGGTKRRAIGNVVRSAVREGRNVKRQKVAENKRIKAIAAAPMMPAQVASAPGVAQVPSAHGVAPQAAAVNGANKEEYQVPNPLPSVSAVLDPYVTSTMGMPPPPAPVPGTAAAAASAQAKKGQQRGRQQLVHTATHGTLPMAALEDAVFRLLTPATGAPAPMPGAAQQPLPPHQPSNAIVDPLAPNQPGKIPVAHTQYQNPNAPPLAGYPQGALPNSSPTGVADMSLLPSWVDAKNPPAWYNDGSDIDTLLEDADCLNWLSDTGDLEETYPPAMAEPAVVSSSSTAVPVATAMMEPTPVMSVHDPATGGLVHPSAESLSFLVDPPEQHLHHGIAPHPSAVAAHHHVQDVHQLPTFLDETAAPLEALVGQHPLAPAAELSYASATEAVEAVTEPIIPKLAGVGESDTNLMGFPDLDMGDEQAFVSALLENSGQSTMSFPKLNSDLHMHTTTAMSNGNGQSIHEEQGANDVP